MRVCERLLELSQLRVGERGSVAPLLPARIMIERAELLRRAAVVVAEVARRVLLAVVRVGVVIERRGRDEAARRAARARVGARVHLEARLVAACEANFRFESGQFVSFCAKSLDSLALL